MTVPPAEQLRDQIAAAARTVQLFLGPNAIAVAQAGNPVRLSGGEADALADAVLAAAQPEFDRLHGEIRRMNERSSRRRRVMQATQESERILQRLVNDQAVELEQARQQTAAVLAICDQAERGATRWEHPLPVPEWVATVRAAAQPTV